MRRQFGVGGAIPAGSGRVMRLDPHFLPVKFDTRDMRADGGIRHIEINRERITVRRAVSGMSMAVNVRVADFLGIALRETEDAFALMLVHRDPSLSVPLLLADDAAEIDQAWVIWADVLALPRLENDSCDGLVRTDAEPAPRRRRHNAIRARRPRFLMRRKPGSSLRLATRHIGEREIIARN